MDVTISFVDFIGNIKTPTPENADRIMDAIKTRHVSKNGFINMGLCDTDDFALWKIFGANMPGIRKYFGPIYLADSFETATNILTNIKNSEGDHNDDSDEKKGYFIGNRSTYVVKHQIGSNNLFATKHKDIHMSLKVGCKNAFYETIGKCGNLNTGVQLMTSEFVKNWLDRVSKLEFFNLKVEMNTLIAGFFCIVLLNKNPYDTNLDDIVKYARSFSKRVTQPLNKNPFKKVMKLFQSTKYKDAITDIEESELCKSIEKTNPGCGVEMIKMLEKVGFANIHSALSSLFFRLSTCSSENIAIMRTELQQNKLNESDEINFVNFNKGFSSNFFFETLRLAPPVWLQARKVGSVEMNIGDAKLAPYSLLLISNYMLARHMRPIDPHIFNPHVVTGEEKMIFNPFSSMSSPNSCVGRYLALPFIEMVVGELLKNYNICPISVSEEYDGGVAISFKNDMILKLIKN